MTEWLTTAIAAAIPSVLCGVFMFYFQRQQRRKDKRVEHRAEARREESLLHLELQMATAKLAFATAVAVKRGKANGEVDDGIEVYETARHKYLAFLNEQAAEHLNQ